MRGKDISCYFCEHRKDYYHGKNQKPYCLISHWCEYNNKEVERRIAVSRYSLLDKILTHPRWCPLVKKGE